MAEHDIADLLLGLLLQSREFRDQGWQDEIDLKYGRMEDEHAELFLAFGKCIPVTWVGAEDEMRKRWGDIVHRPYLGRTSTTTKKTAATDRLMHSKHCYDDALS